MTADEEEIRGLIAEWARASEDGDLDAIDPLMDAEVLFLTPGNEPFGRESFRQRFEKYVKPMRIKVRSEVQEVAVSGDLAFARTSLEILVQVDSSEPMRRTGFSLTVYRRGAGGRWKLWRDANLVS
ncbi:MAG TPA: SgcJ/EcaC family oxidoreductase [Acidobacteriaceae bacterium]